MKAKCLFVYMNGLEVGTLTYQAFRNYIFTYATSWLTHPQTRPISLSLPLTEAPLKDERVYHFFDNLLPDSELIRERIQARFQTSTHQCFDLLSYIGSDCVGALQLLIEPYPVDIQKIQAQKIDHHFIAKLLKNYRTAPLGMDRTNDFRLSLAGAQEKTALLWHKKQWYLPQYFTPTTHIIKLPIGRIDHSGIDLSESVENEWLCLQILAAYNLPVNSAAIVHFEEVKTLVLERFDRRWNADKTWIMRLPQEDLCQALGKSSALKYESDGGPGIKSIMDLLRGAHDAQADRKQFMKSVFLFWMLGAIDGHAKNFSVFIEAGGNYRLTPLYDVISVYPLVAKRQLELKDVKMAMAVKSKSRHYGWHNIQRRHWLAMAEECQFPAQIMEEIIIEVCDQLEEVIEDLSEKSADLVPSHISESIFSGMRKIKNKCG